MDTTISISSSESLASDAGPRPGPDNYTLSNVLQAHLPSANGSSVVSMVSDPREPAHQLQVSSDHYHGSVSSSVVGSRNAVIIQLPGRENPSSPSLLPVTG